MQVFTTLIATVSLALAVSAAPVVESRDKGVSYITCDTENPVAVGSVYNGNTYFGLGSTTTTGADGNVDQVLVSLDDNGKAITPQQWQFIQCKSKFLGTDTASGTFGYLNQPGTKNGLCLQTKTGSVKTADQVMVSAVCSHADTSDQLQQTFELFADGGLKFISSRLQSGSVQHPTYFTTSTQNHKALKLNAGSIPKGSDGAAILGFKKN